MAEPLRHDRPLGRSLDPLPEESLGGYLLRLAHRLHLSPIRLARLTGCTKQPSTTQLGRTLLLGLDVVGFARATRLSEAEVAALTLVPWADRYPPIAHMHSGTGARASRDDWLFNNIPRYCPQCLAGDGTLGQQQFGGPWKKVWQLPIAFACPGHRVFLHHGCPRSHPSDRAITQLITQAADSSLHPTQCRHPDQPGSRGRKGPSCGVRLDQRNDADTPRPSESMLKTQQRLLDLLEPHRPAKDAVTQFTDLRVVTALLCASWPHGRDLIDPSPSAAVNDHIRALGSGARQVLDRPPTDPTATAALLTAAATLLDASDLNDTLAKHVRATWEGRPSRAPWTRIFARHGSSCSEVLQQAAEPATHAYRRRSGPHSPKAPVRADGYLPEHVPAFL
ncbi:MULTISPECIES: TniQ family protein [unclassified Streptomyces]|uniref:TniQ family protein n=1 Tax=unclassified Streptomyces TaxID=2593676 RepID=UPI0033949ACC